MKEVDERGGRVTAFLLRLAELRGRTVSSLSCRRRRQPQSTYALVLAPHPPPLPPTHMLKCTDAHKNHNNNDNTCTHDTHTQHPHLRDGCLEHRWLGDGGQPHQSHTHNTVRHHAVEGRVQLRGHPNAGLGGVMEEVGMGMDGAELRCGWWLSSSLC